jgi:predicted nucleic acid-binding protein
MSVGPTVCNSSPLIALDQIGHLDLLQLLFAEITIPPAVAAEVPPSATARPWIVQRPCGKPLALHHLSGTLGPGECEAIGLALEISAAPIILDDRPARRAAQRLGLSVIGTLGLLLAAKRKGFLPVLRPLVDAQAAANFRARPSLVQQMLTDAGE